MFSNNDIEMALHTKDIVIENYNSECLRPSSYLLRINNVILEQIQSDSIIDTKNSDTNQFFKQKYIEEGGFILQPNTLYLMSSLEKVSFSNKIAGILSQISSLARIGICTNFSSNLVCSTFGMVEPSSITFEVINLSNIPVKIYPYVKFVHISFFKNDTDSNLSYEGIYACHDIPKASNFMKKPSR